MQVNYNGSTSIETAIVNLQRQSKFGQGFDNSSLDSDKDVYTKVLKVKNNTKQVV